MLNSLLGDDFLLLFLVSSAACVLLGFLLARIRDQSAWLGAAVGFCVNLLVVSRGHVRFTTWLAERWGLPYSEGASVIVLVAAVALLFPYPLIALRSRKYAATVLGISVATTVISVFLHMGLGAIFIRPAPPPVASEAPVPVVPSALPRAKALPAHPPAPPPVAQATGVLRLVPKTTPLYHKKDGVYVPSTHVARQGSWVLVLPPTAPQDEDFVEVLLSTPEGRYVMNWSPRGYVRARSLGEVKGNGKRSVEPNAPPERPGPEGERAGPVSHTTHP
jgi:hypothetical protein